MGPKRPYTKGQIGEDAQYPVYLALDMGAPKTASVGAGFRPARIDTGMAIFGRE